MALKLKIIVTNFRLRIVHILITVTIFGLIFEVVLPTLDPSLTRDPRDILAYLVGGLIVYGVGAIQSVITQFNNGKN